MKKEMKKKLKLHRETVRALNANNLTEVAGGTFTKAPPCNTYTCACSDSCFPCI